MIIPPQPVAPMHFAPYAEGQEGGGADEQGPYAPVDLALRIHELHVGPSPGGFHAGGAGGSSRAGGDRLVPGEEHNTTPVGRGRESEGDDEPVLLSTAEREKGREESRKKERLAAQVTGWRHDRDVIIGSEQEVTGRGGKSQKHLSLNSWRHPSCWVRIGFLFIPAPPTGQPGCVGDGGDTNGK